MKILMFGWEFPPHISGGLGTACFGLTRSLVKENVQILFVVPRAYGDEETSDINLINASNVTISEESSQAAQQSVIQEMMQTHGMATIPASVYIAPYTTAIRHEIQQPDSLSQWNYEFKKKFAVEKNAQGKRYKFSGSYGPDLLEEVMRYAEVASEIAQHHSFDIIHGHDWLTYPAAIEAKRISGKPLVVHIHATEYDRAGIHADKRVVKIEQEGMMQADKVIAVSNWTKNIVTKQYGIPPEKVDVVHNGVTPKINATEIYSLPPINKPIVTFLGRITYQKGPQYFVEAARLVLEKIPDVHFVMAGAGDLLPEMIERVAELRLSSRFHFTGFLKGEQVDRIWKMTNVYVMPSVSEPFGIAPLEALQSGVPVIISNQSGVAEVVENAIKIDFWNSKSMAKAIIRILKNKRLSKSLIERSANEIKNINWDNAARKINILYHELTSN